MGSALFSGAVDTDLQRIPDAVLVLSVWEAWQDCLQAAACSRHALPPPALNKGQHKVLAAFAVAFWQPRLLRLAYPVAIPAGLSSLALVSRQLLHLEIVAPALQQLDVVVAACPQLLCLCLRGCSSLGDASLAVLSTLTHLRALDLGGLSLTDGACYHIAKAPALAALNLSHTGVTDKGLELLTYGHKVRAWQRATGAASLPPEVAAGWPQLPLEHLQLAGAKVGPEGVTQLEHLPRIRFLDMRHTGISRGALAPLQRRFALQSAQAAVLSGSNSVAAAVLNHDMVLCRCSQGSRVSADSTGTAADEKFEAWEAAGVQLLLQSDPADGPECLLDSQHRGQVRIEHELQAMLGGAALPGRRAGYRHPRPSSSAGLQAVGLRRSGVLQ